LTQYLHGYFQPVNNSEFAAKVVFWLLFPGLMHRKKFLLIFLFILLQLKAFSAVFVVTSNADSGPGTLRDALTQAAANGTTEIDYINFNLPGNTTADITIAVKTQLPDVTGNVIIDGTTQPGPALGVSNAKVIISPVTPMQNLNAFNISNSVGQNDNVEFYGLYITGFYEYSIGYGSAITLGNICNLVVGAPGKGNVICNNNAGIAHDLGNTTIQSNFIGIEPDGETPSPNVNALYADNYSNLLIGGDDPADGNVFMGEIDGVINLGNGITGSGTTVIKNNYFGTDFKGTNPIESPGEQAYIYMYVASINITIADNVFNTDANNVTCTAVGNSTMLVTGNYFGTDKTQTHPFVTTYFTALALQGFLTTTVGGANDADQNVFAHYANPIFTDNLSLTDIIKNKFYCNNGVVVNNNNQVGNFVRIVNLTDTQVSGDALPGATVQLYYSTTQCGTCNPNTWFATVTADNNGKWSYTGDTRQNIMASATIGGNTFGFQPFSVTQFEINIINGDCHQKGSIEITEKRTGRFQFIWTDSNGKILGTGQKIDNLSAGYYTIEINEGGTCPAAKGTYLVTDQTPQAFPQTFQLDCHSTTASFNASATTVPNFTIANYYWLDDKGNNFSNASSVTGLAAGNYYLYITDSNGCNSDTVLYAVLPPVNSPLIDGGKAIVKDANCSFSDGSVTGISVSSYGDGNYGWKKADGTSAANGQLNLENAAPGQYYFYVEYSTACPPVQSAVFTINEINGVSITDAKVQISPTSCSINNGSITALTITGATAYQWVDINNKIVGTNADLTDVGAGSYTLTASNAYCTATSKTYTITQIAPTQYPVYTVTQVQPCFGQSDGSLTIATDFLVKSERWVNSQNQSAGSGPVAANLPADTYRLFLTDNNGCESAYGFYSLQQLPQLQFLNTGLPLGSTCGLSNGSITDVQVAGGMPPYTYKWTNADTGVPIGTNSNTITNLSSGNFNLEVTDSRCGNTKVGYFIADDQTDISTPAVTNVELCSSGGALVKVNNPVAGSTYRLYDTPKSQQPLAENETGQFTVSVTANRSFYITRAIGTCESSRAEVDVSVGISAINIANTFTPNGDNINDYWVIKNIENYPNALVQVFNRYGQVVFFSNGYGTSWDGTINSKPLPVGTYYYIINLSTNCNLLSGSLTIIR